MSTNSSKRRLVWIGLPLLLIIIVAGYFILDKLTVKYEAGSIVQTEEFNGYAALKAVSPVIVKATATNHSSPYNFKIGDTFDKKQTKTEVTIDEVIQGDLKAGDKAVILEGYYTSDNEGFSLGQTIFMDGNYTPLVPKAKYALFLAWSEEHQSYWVISNHIGKVNLDGKDKREKKVEFSPSDKSLRSDILSSMK